MDEDSHTSGLSLSLSNGSLTFFLHDTAVTKTVDSLTGSKKNKITHPFYMLRKEITYILTLSCLLLLTLRSLEGQRTLNPPHQSGIVFSARWHQLSGQHQ